MYALTGSAFFLGLVGLAQFLPMFLLSLVAGQMADRFDRRSIVRLCQLVEGCAVALLAVSSWGGWASKENILAIVFVIGAAHAFEAPTMQALLPALVPAEIFPRATARAASAFQTATIIGPALGGLLYATGEGIVYGVGALMFFLASLLVSLIRVEGSAPPRAPGGLRSVFAGIAFIRGRPEILGAISLDLFAVLLGGATALLPIYARDILATGPWGLGILRSAPAAGALAMSAVLARVPPRRRVGRTMFVAVVLFGAATIVFAVSRSLPLSMAALVALGAADVVSVVIRSSLVQLSTPDAMRGRVSAVNSMFIGTSNQLGEFESGVTAAWLGAVPAALVGGIGTIVVALLWMRLFPSLRRADKLHP